MKQIIKTIIAFETGPDMNLQDQALARRSHLVLGRRRFHIVLRGGSNNISHCKNHMKDFIHFLNPFRFFLSLEYHTGYFDDEVYEFAHFELSSFSHKYNLFNQTFNHYKRKYTSFS